MRILIVEDQRKMAGFIQRGLKEEKYAVDVAYDAEKALYAADVNEYDLIVLDIMLPRTDGFAICRKIRGQEKFNQIPIIILSARAEEVKSVTDRITPHDDSYFVRRFNIVWGNVEAIGDPD